MQKTTIFVMSNTIQEQKKIELIKTTMIQCIPT